MARESVAGGKLDGRRALSTGDAAKYIGWSEIFLRAARSKGKRKNRTPGPAFVKVGRKVVYLIDDLDRWLEQHRRGEARLT